MTSRAQFQKLLRGEKLTVEVLLHGAPDDVRRACRECQQQTAGYDNFILAPGCEVPPHTPPANYQTLIEYGWQFNAAKHPPRYSTP